MVGKSVKGDRSVDIGGGDQPKRERERERERERSGMIWVEESRVGGLGEKNRGKLKAMKCFDEFCDETNLNKLNLPGFVM